MGADQITRTALLGLDNEADESRSNRRMVGGVSALERQVDAALALGCERIWLFAPQQDAAAIAAQKLTEQGGAQFRLIQKGRQLLGTLRQQDDLLVLAEGLVVPDHDALELLQGGSVILRVPADLGAKAGFERLDQEYCWAGAMRLPGRVIERLDDLAEDMDPISALLRAGRISRVPERDIPQEWLMDGRWSLSATQSPMVPGDLTSNRSLLESNLIDPIAAALLAWPPARLAVAAVTVVLVTSGAILLGQKLAWLALLSIVASEIFARVWWTSRRLADPRVFSSIANPKANLAIRGIFVPLGLAALTLGLFSEYDAKTAFYIALLTGFIWLLATKGSGRFAGFFREFSVLWLICAAAGIAGQWFWGAAIASTLSAVAILLNMRNQPAITQA